MRPPVCRRGATHTCAGIWEYLRRNGWEPTGALAAIGAHAAHEQRAAEDDREEKHHVVHRPE